MGYYTRLSGEITIDPPLTDKELEKIPDYLRSNSQHREQGALVIDVTEDVQHRGTWTRVVRSASKIVPSIYERSKGYEIEVDLQDILNAIGKDHTFSGRIEGEGESNGDMWRLYAREGKAVKVSPRIIWPDDTWGKDG